MHCKICNKPIDNNVIKLKCYGLEIYKNCEIHENCINKWKLMLLDNGINKYIYLNKILQKNSTLEDWLEQAHLMHIPKIYVIFWNIYFSNLINRGLFYSRKSISKIDNSCDYAYTNMNYTKNNVIDNRKIQIELQIWFKNLSIKEMVDVIKLSKTIKIISKNQIEL